MIFVPVVSLMPLRIVTDSLNRPKNGRPKATHCKRGHPLINGNLYNTREGQRCKTCRGLDNHLRSEKRRARNG